MMMWFAATSFSFGTYSISRIIDVTRLFDVTRSNERPRQFMLDDEIYEIPAVLDQWYEPSATYFKVQSTEGRVYLLRYEESTDEWTLQSGFDGDELLARPSIKLITV